MTKKTLYYIATGLLTALMLFSVSMYLTNTSAVQDIFESLGYPRYLVIPLAIAKILGLLAIWVFKNRALKEWAYAGFFFDVVLAFFAHIMVQDGEQLFALLGVIFVLSSYYFWDQLKSEHI